MFRYCLGASSSGHTMVSYQCKIPSCKNLSLRIETVPYHHYLSRIICALCYSFRIIQIYIGVGLFTIPGLLWKTLYKKWFQMLNFTFINLILPENFDFGCFKFGLYSLMRLCAWNSLWHYLDTYQIRQYQRSCQIGL